MKKIITILFVTSILISVTGCNFNQNVVEKNNKKNIQSNQTTSKKKYELIGGELGEYGREIILNANTDLPAKKILYKIPSGTYKVTTTFEKLSAFWIVKDEIVKTGSDEYPEELEYVGEQQSLTAGDNDFNGMAKKEIEVTINEDESINITSMSTLIFEEK